MRILSDETYEFIKGEATNVLICNNITELPVNGMELARKMGITLVSYNPFMCDGELLMKVSSDGFSFVDDSKEYIYYNECINDDRKNMTILHEIGHIVLDHRITFETSQRDKELAEAEANFFAKYVAAPPPLIHRLAFKFKTPTFISEIFGLSFQASKYALNYYRKWLNRFNRFGVYSDNEINLLGQFRCYN